MLDNNKFWTKGKVEINDSTTNGKYGVDDQIKFKTTMISSGLCGYGDVCILAKETIKFTGVGIDASAR